MTAARSRLMTVGELSRRTGVPIKALREYTDMGLIYSEGRSQSGYRLFTTDALWCVHWIGRLRGLGLTLAEIRDLARHRPQSNGALFGPRLAERLRAARTRLDTRIAELQQMRAQIDEFEAAHHAELAGLNGSDSWVGDPTSCADCA